MKKVLFFIESLSGGGAEKVLTDLVANLDPNTYQITVCSFIDIGVYNKQIQEVCNYKYILPNPNKLNTLKLLIYQTKYFLFRKLPAKWLYRYFFKEKYDVEVAFIEGYATKVIGNSNNLLSKKIAWVHIDLYANHWTHAEYKSLEEEVANYKNFNHIVSVAESVQKAFSKRFGLHNNLCVKYNPVDRESIIRKAKESVTLPKNGDKYLFATVGRLEDQKGYDRLLVVIKKLVDDNIPVQLWIIGDGSKRQELDSYIIQNDLKEHVTLLGFQSNPYKYIAAANAFVCSSRSEGFSTVVTEALILGKPIVATNCSGMTELLGDNEYGLVTQNNTEDLYKQLKRFISDKNLQKHYSLKSKERSIYFDINKTVKSIEEIL